MPKTNEERIKELEQKLKIKELEEKLQKPASKFVPDKNFKRQNKPPALADLFERPTISARQAYDQGIPMWLYLFFLSFFLFVLMVVKG